MGRPKKATAPKEEPAEAAAPKETVSKAEAVRQAIAAGMDTPADGVEFIKAHYGIEMPRPMWSSYVSQAKAREQKKSGEPAKRGPKPKLAATAPEPAPANGDGDLLSALEALKPLIASQGAEKLHRLIDVLK